MAPAEITDLRLCVAFTLCKRRVNITAELLLKVTPIAQHNYPLLYQEQGKYSQETCSQSNGPTELLGPGQGTSRQDWPGPGDTGDSWGWLWGDGGKWVRER